MGSNIFQIKGWMITINAAIIAIYASQNNPSWVYFIIAMGTTIVFTFLDACYLRRERQYQELYYDVKCDFINQTNKIEIFEMNASCYKSENCTLIKSLSSSSLLGLYLPILITLLLLFYVTYFKE